MKVNLTIRRKMVIIFTVTALICFLSLGALILTTVNDAMNESISTELDGKTQIIKNNIENLIESSIKSYLRGITEKNIEIINYYYGQFQQGLITEAEAKQIVEGIILSQSIGETGYLFAADIKDSPDKITITIHPSLPFGSNVAKYDFIQLSAEMKSGYIEYEWQAAADTVPREKTMYIGYFPEWNWIVAASSYKDEFINLMDPADFRENFLSIKIGDTGYPMIVDYEGNFILHPTLEGKNVLNIQDASGRYFIQEVLEQKNGSITYNWRVSKDEKPRDKFAYFASIPEMEWVVIISGYTDEYHSLRYHIQKVLIISIFVILAVFIVVIILYSGRIVKPVLKINTMLKEISQGEGDLTQRLEITNRDEIGEMAGHFNTFVENLRNIIINIAENVSVAKGNSSIMLDAMVNSKTSTTEIEEMTGSIKDLIIDQSAVVTEVTSTVEEIARTIENQNMKISSQSTNVTDSSAAIEEMIANIRSIGNNLNNNSIEFEKLQNVVNTGNDHIGRLKETITALSVQSDSVMDANAVIQNIASQTNLLAMNAAIEAAHAGESGKGFAVVSDEIRKLAEVSNQQSKIISDNLSHLRSSIDSVVSLSEDAGASFDSIVKSVDIVTTLEKEIENSLSEQSSGGTQVLEALNNISQITEEVHSGSNEMLVGSKAILDDMTGLVNTTENVKVLALDISEKSEKVKNIVDQSVDMSNKNIESISEIKNRVSAFKT